MLILAGNTRAFAVISFAALASGRSACPVSTTYAALGGDYGRLAHVIDKVKPGVIFAENTKACAAALSALDLGGAVIVTGDPEGLGRQCRGNADPGDGNHGRRAGLNGDDGGDT